MAKIFLYLIVICLALSLGYNLVLANTNQPTTGTGLGNTQGNIETTRNEAGIGAAGDIGTFLAEIVKALLSFVGILFVILFIYGGFLYMTSAGKDEKINKAKKVMINATIGLIIVIGAYAIASFVAGIVEQ